MKRSSLNKALIDSHLCFMFSMMQNNSAHNKTQRKFYSKVYREKHESKPWKATYLISGFTKELDNHIFSNSWREKTGIFKVAIQ